MRLVDFLELIKKDRGERKNEYFEGTFLDYIEILSKSSDLNKLAHQRMYEIILDEGVEVVNTEEESKLRRIYGNDV
ncbi:MAG: serine protein kinase, partial [Clostridia bacterium]|nr:serine protein kinase [Clostridia bacterium]